MGRKFEQKRKAKWVKEKENLVKAYSQALYLGLPMQLQCDRCTNIQCKLTMFRDQLPHTKVLGNDVMVSLLVDCSTHCMVWDAMM